MKITSKHNLIDQTLLIYTGQYFEGFHADKPYMTFLGYDSGGWSNIWGDYLGGVRFVSLNDVEIAEER